MGAGIDGRGSGVLDGPGGAAVRAAWGVCRVKVSEDGRRGRLVYLSEDGARFGLGLVTSDEAGAWRGDMLTAFEHVDALRRMYLLLGARWSLVRFGADDVEVDGDACCEPR